MASPIARLAGTAKTPAKGAPAFKRFIGQLGDGVKIVGHKDTLFGHSPVQQHSISGAPESSCLCGHRVQVWNPQQETTKDVVVEVLVNEQADHSGTPRKRLLLRCRETSQEPLSDAGLFRIGKDRVDLHGILGSPAMIVFDLLAVS
jgi:hypothetical protein